MKRFTLQLADEVVRDLDAYADRHNTTRTAAIKVALGLLKIYDEETTRGNELCITASDHTRFICKIIGF